MLEAWYIKRVKQLEDQGQPLAHKAAKWKNDLKFERRCQWHVDATETCSRWVFEKFRP